MINGCAWPKDAALTLQAKAKAKVYIFAIAKEALVKAANAQKGVPVYQG